MGMSQAELAEKCGVLRTTITNVESENSDPSYNLLRYIAIALELELMLVPKENKNG